jgi:hypothetical protein
MIVRLDRQTPMTCFQVVRWDCTKALLRPEDVYAHVHRKFCPQPDITERSFDGCEWKVTKRPAPTPPTIKYPAYEVDENGRVCFMWDGLLWSQDDGRYVVEIFVCGEKRDTVELQLESKVRFTKYRNKKQGCGIGCATV